jgi:predicted RNase H-like HicB family nuclease
VSERNAAERPVVTTLTVALSAVVHPEQDAGGFSAEIPAPPGCYTQGESLEEVRDNLREAAEGWLAAAHDAAVRALVTEDLAAFRERANDPSVSFANLVRDLKHRGKL